MNKPLLVLRYPNNLSQERYEMALAALKPVAESIGAEPLVVCGGVEAAVHQDLAPLISAIEANTRAIEGWMRTSVRAEQA